ncbi:MAG: hypothetical protein HY773_02285 [Candidatus Terrybacteria bacterium]|nr:hypothetical protein [Candidatus Terrybacteria bacterium]
MILPLIFFSLFTALVFYLRWRNQQPKKEEVPSAPSEKEPAKKPRKKIKLCRWGTAGVVVALITTGIVYHLLAPKIPAVDYIEEAIWLTDENPTATISLQPNCWSKKICLPPSRKFLVDISEKLEGIKFWDGTEWDRATLVKYLKETDGWMGKIPHSTFRLRGQGEATITI